MYRFYGSNGCYRATRHSRYIWSNGCYGSTRHPRYNRSNGCDRSNGKRRGYWSHWVCRGYGCNGRYGERGIVGGDRRYGSCRCDRCSWRHGGGGSDRSHRSNGGYWGNRTELDASA